MKASELKKLSGEAITEKLRVLYQERFNLKFRNATSQLDNTARIRQVRREIARIKTIVGSKSGEEQGA